MNSACRMASTGLLCSLASVLLAACANVQDRSEARAAQAYGRAHPLVAPLPDGTILCEAEEFRIVRPGWRARTWGTNYYAGTINNVFLSRKAYLGAPEQCHDALATVEVEVPADGRYLALVRYETAYRFETQFRLRVRQGGRTVLDRRYGAQEDLKIWHSGRGLCKVVTAYGVVVGGIVWEGHDAYADLRKGRATLELVAGRQPADAARRNVDCVMLTRDVAEIERRIPGKGRNLPLDGLLTQAGDLYLRLHNAEDGSPLTLNVSHGTEHSPYWLHDRNWQPRAVTAAPGEASEWVEVGSLLDTLNDGQWGVSATPAESDGVLHYEVEFGVPAPEGGIEPIRAFECRSRGLALAYDADTRYTRRVRRVEEVLYELVDWLKAHPVHGRRPRQTLVYCYTFDPKPEDPRYTEAVAEFIRLTGINGFASGGEGLEVEMDVPSGYAELRGHSPAQLEEIAKRLQAEGKADQIAVVSMGDEIGLPSPPSDDHTGFREWARQKGLEPGDVTGDANATWDDLHYSPLVYEVDPSERYAYRYFPPFQPQVDTSAAENPRLYYYSQLYRHDYGIRATKKRTDALRPYLRNAGIGANFAAHAEVHYLGGYSGTHAWVRLFREDGFTLPWGEDYIWRTAVGSTQMNFISLDLFRAGLKNRPDGKILFYVMPHWPGNTPNTWRRLFYGSIAHGMKIVDLFEFRPVQAAYTENHVSSPQMYQAVRRGLHEMGLFEDIMQAGHVRRGLAALWFGEPSDIWGDNWKAPFGAAKRTLYVAIRAQQLPLDVVVEEDAIADDLGGYKILYLTEPHVSLAASKGIARWVENGGRLFATAGAGMFDEFDRPNPVLRELLGVDEKELQRQPGLVLTLCKQDLPHVDPIDAVRWQAESGSVANIPVIGVRSRFEVKDAAVKGTFSDGSPALTVRQAGRGTAVYCGFLPGLSFFKPAIPKRPVDRGTTDESMAHFVPSAFDAGVRALMAWCARGVDRPVLCSEPLVATSVIESQRGVVIPLVNWSGSPVRKLTVEVRIDVPTHQVELASGKPVKATVRDGKSIFTLDLDVADALILR